MTQIDKSHFNYCPFFCEENIYHLIYALNTSQNFNIDNAYALIITNKTQTCKLFAQNLGQDTHHAVTWDYHVVMLYDDKKIKTWQIWDFDSRTHFPEKAESYLTETFPEERILPTLRSYFRKIPAKTYLNEFNSDRKLVLRNTTPIPFPKWHEIHNGNLFMEDLLSFNATHLPPFMNLLELYAFLTKKH